MNRRSLITGLASLIVAPAIVRAPSLMRVSGDVYRFWEFRCPLLPGIGLGQPIHWPDYTGPNGRPYQGRWTFFGKDHNIYSDKVVSFEKVEYP